MLALLLSCILGLSGLRAQSNSEYAFRQQSVIWGQGYNGNSDPTPTLGMNCLAANGYGQWTYDAHGGEGSSASIYPKGWYLLANGMYAPSTGFVQDDPNHPGCIPPGVVQNGQMAGGVTVAEEEVTTNLDGAVTYVWPDQNGATWHQDFFVQGFRASDVDLSLSFLSNPHTPMNIVGAQYTANVPPTQFPNISTGAPSNDITWDADWREEFDVCSDAAYLYIAWCSTKNNPLGQIFYEILDINTLTPIPGTVWPALAGVGMRPTVACDPRDNRNGSATAHFDLAFIAPVEGSYITMGTLTGGALVWEDYNAGMWTPYPITANIQLPGGPLGNVITYPLAAHARALVSSVLGGAWHPACYAIVGSNPTLILYNPDDPNLPPGPPYIAAYVDGNGLSQPAPVPPTPQPGPAGWPIKDGPIVAMANPYDNQIVSTDNPSNWRGYDQFHCVYQVDVSQNPGQSPYQMYPLLIVRNSDNGEAFPVQPNPNGDMNDTRLVVNQNSGTMGIDPYHNFYLAAVNQMGIHIHWTTFDGTTVRNFYARDMNRTFDEDIDENTLVTDQCTVSDGTAHGGLAGARVDPNVRMAVWTDPNYGPPSVDGTSGLYSPQPLTLNTINPYVGTLKFVGSNVALTVGGLNCPNSDIYNPCPTWLTVMPYFYFNFTGSGQNLNIEQNATFDYYGLLATHDGTGAQTDISTPFTDGTGDRAGAGTINLLGGYIMPGEPGDTAYLNVHGGANFFTGPNTVLNIGGNGNTNFNFESSLFPETSGTPNTSTSGLMTLLGSADVQNSTITGNYPAPDPSNTIVIQDPTIIVEPSTDPSHPSPSTQFTSSGNTYSNNPTTGETTLRFEGTTSSATYGSVDFSNDNFNAVQIRATDPANTFNVGVNGGCTFDNSKDAAIWLNLTNATNAPSYSVGIEGNTFHAVTQISGGDTHLGGIPDQIVTQAFDLTQSNADNSQLNISSNSMTTDDGQANGSVWAAIDLQVSNAEVEGNTISSSKYSRGIADLGAGAGADYFNYTYICSNHISKSNSYGIYTSYSNGHMLLNELDHSLGLGYNARDDGYFSLVENNIHDCSLQGIEVDDQATVDMTGYHPNGSGSSSNDYAAYNRVQNNNTWDKSSNIANATDDDIKGGLIIGKNGNNWSVYSNNIITNDVSNTPDIGLMIGGGSGSKYKDMSNNYWGYGYEGSSTSSHFIDPTNQYDWVSYFDDGNLTASQGIPDPEPTPPSMSCGDPNANRASKGSNHPLSIETGTDSTCFAIFALCNAWVNEDNQYDMAYDTLRKYLVLYPNCENVMQAVTDLGECIGAASQLRTPAGRVDFRNWLLSVRNLSSNPGWYCSMVSYIGSTYNDIPSGLAVLKFLLNDGKCTAFRHAFAASYQTSRDLQISTWMDTAKNDSIQYFDSTLPTLDMLGLDSLLADEASQDVRPNAPEVITNLAASPNPVESGTVLTFGVSQEAYVKIELFDVLGKLQAASGFSGVLPPGNKSVPISLAGLPPGTYYARIQTAYGEVQTVKLVKQ